MPEYLAPGVYVEETSFRAKTIEGVSTSICGMIGPTRYGPVGGEPEILTSFTEFERIYGGIDRLEVLPSPGARDGDRDEVENYLAHGARAFFENGGTKLYVTRVYSGEEGVKDDGHASLGLDSPPTLTIVARFPGAAGNMDVIVEAKLSENALHGTASPPAPELRRVQPGDVVFIGRTPPGTSPPTSLVDASPPPASPPLLHGFFDARRTNGAEWEFTRNGETVALSELTPGSDVVHVVTALVSSEGNGRFDVEQGYGEFAFRPERNDSITGYFEREPGSRRRSLSLPIAVETSATDGSVLASVLLPDLENALQARHEQDPPGDEGGGTREERRRARVAVTEALRAVHTLEGGHDGVRVGAIDYEGREADGHKTGLVAFEDVEDISMLAAPGYSALFADDATAGDAAQIEQHLLSHADRMRYRIAVLDSGPGMAISEVRAQRARIDALRGAMYYPWITVIDPLAERGTPRADQELQLPPSGFVAGIYARNDVERGVHKAPANEVVRGAVGLEVTLSKAQQDVLNPDGINAFRFFEGRGFRLWGARTTSSDPEWKYVNVRRYFLYLERSIEKGTQWAVFENNGPELWANVTRTVEDFLFTEWNNGALLGLKPEEAYFVRCDRTTMTQNDIDNGRLICLIGVAPLRPAEFVIFRIGQWTADSQR